MKSGPFFVSAANSKFWRPFITAATGWRFSSVRAAWGSRGRAFHGCTKEDAIISLELWLRRCNLRWFGPLQKQARLRCNDKYYQQMYQVLSVRDAWWLIGSLCIQVPSAWELPTKPACQFTQAVQHWCRTCCRHMLQHCFRLSKRSLQTHV